MAWVQDCFVYQAVYTKLGTSRFCITSMGHIHVHCILKTYAEASGAVKVFGQHF